MKSLISFSEFIRLPKSVQESMGTFDNEYLQEELSPTAHKKKMVELERALKQKDWTYFMSDDGKDRKRGEVENEKIIKMRDELGSDGATLFNVYYQKLMPKHFREGVDKRIPRPSEYEKFLYAKMKEWKITDLNQLQGEAKKRFDKECEDEYKGSSDVKVNLPKSESMFPEMDQVIRQGTLGYGEERPVGGKSKHGFVDAGNLYPEHLVPKWIPPSPQRKRGWQDK